MAELIHEVWIAEYNEQGLPLHMCCLAGPDGDGARSFNGPGSYLWCVFRAGSYFEAMDVYNELLDRGPYTTEFDRD